MIREIKFRAWDRENQVMHVFDSLRMMDNGVFFENSNFNMGDGHNDGTEAVLMQFTGLKDSEEIEIYEGDIVRFTYWWFDGDHAESTLTGEVIYLPGSMSYGLRGVKNADWIRHIGGKEGESDTAPFATWRFEGDDFHVIGNIHQNPELLADAVEGSV